jgi:fused signal recognition particle receptor
MGLRDRLEKSRALLAGRLARIFSPGRAVDAAVLAEAEQALLESDLGWELTEKVLDGLAERMRKTGSGWREALGDLLVECFPVPPPRPRSVAKPEVVLLVGVNGSGKTTTIARLAARESAAGRKVLLACADTFRAAAAEQLQEWGRRLDLEVLVQLPGADPGAVAFDAVRKGLAGGYDCVVIDTAGRLPNRAGLMAELAKVARVCGKAMEGAPHRVLLVLDATTGQNALAQAEQFGASVPVTGLVLTKLDGTAKGGAVMAMAHRLGLPVEYVGIGEGREDLVDFDQRAFVEALLDE